MGCETSREGHDESDDHAKRAQDGETLLQEFSPFTPRGSKKRHDAPASEEALSRIAKAFEHEKEQQAKLHEQEKALLLERLAEMERRMDETRVAQDTSRLASSNEVERVRVSMADMREEMQNKLLATQTESMEQTFRLREAADRDAAGAKAKAGEEVARVLREKEEALFEARVAKHEAEVERETRTKVEQDFRELQVKELELENGRKIAEEQAAKVRTFEGAGGVGKQCVCVCV